MIKFLSRNFLRSFDNGKYADQWAMILACITPLMTLGYTYSIKLFLGSMLAGFIVAIIFLVALFTTKKKIVPQWLRNTISTVIFFYLAICMPAIITICSGQNAWPELYFGIILIITYIIAILIRKRVTEKNSSSAKA